ncbi:MAG: 50S ribosomal protein L3 N(5)-glutamine methyltransferase [Hyphomicrobium sp.]
MTDTSPGPNALSILDDLATVRDWLRYGVSRFTGANLSYGHGTARALDDAAFLILETLNLPIDTLDPWLDCRLTRDERMRISDVFTRRIESRKPAAYLVNKAYIADNPFYVDERVIVPRSYIGELLCADRLATAVADAEDVRSVLELCTGSGCLAILAALAFPNARVVASDISRDALDVAARNVLDYDLLDRIALTQADGFDGLAAERFDLIIANPPYVTAAAVAAFPPEYRAEPELAHLGGEDGLALVHRILAGAARFLTPDGVLVMEVGDAQAALEAAYPTLPFIWLDTAESAGEVFMLAASDLPRDGEHTSAPARKSAAAKPKARD